MRFGVQSGGSGGRRWIVAAAGLVACEGTGGAGDGTVTTRDSAGVTIVENTSSRPPGIPTWSIDTIPEVTIGAESGDPAYEFGEVGSVYQLPNGMILVVNGQGESAYEFRFFDSTGKHVATHGRRGQGPGDFRWVNFVGSAGGDTVIAVDFPNARLSWVSASAGYVRSVRLDENRFKNLVGDDASGIIETMVPLGDSLYAVKAFRRIPDATSPFQRANSFELVDLAAGRASQLAKLDEPSLRRVELSQGPMMTRASATEGTPVHVVDRQRRRICATRTTETELSCLDAQGRRMRIRWRIDTVPYTAEDQRAVEASLRTSLLRSRYTETDVRAMLAARDWPKHHPPITVLQMDAEGRFWILEPAVGNDGKGRARFRVLDPDGRQIAFADSFPVRNVGLGSRTYIGVSSVIRAYETADGVPVVGVFAIDKGAPARQRDSIR